MRGNLGEAKIPDSRLTIKKKPGCAGIVAWMQRSDKSAKRVERPQGGPKGERSE